jgi:hypothetical protein
MMPVDVKTGYPDGRRSVKRLNEPARFPLKIGAG